MAVQSSISDIQSESDRRVERAWQERVPQTPDSAIATTGSDAAHGQHGLRGSAGSVLVA